MCLFGRSENFLLLRDVLERVGMTRDKFMLLYSKEVIVHEIGQKLSDPRLSALNDETAAEGVATCIEFVRISDVIRRLLNIDITLISTTDRLPLRQQEMCHIYDL